MRRAALVVVAALLAQVAGAHTAQRFVGQGIAVDLDLAAPDGMTAGSDIRLSLQLSDAVTGTPLAAAKPAAWLSLNRRGVATDDRVCARKVAAFLGSNPLARPDVDLTGFSLLTMNRDPSITVIDPQSGYNGSRTIAEIALDSPGTDWAVGADPPRLYVLQPTARRVAVVDTNRWQRIGTIATQDPPGAVQLSRDGRTLWIAAATDGVLLAVDTTSLQEIARLPLGRGAHRLARTGNGRFLLVTNSNDDTVTIIDARGIAQARTIKVGAAPSPIAVSDLAGAIYVAAADAIIAIDPTRDMPPARIEGVSDVGALGIAPDGRWGFAASSTRNQVTIFDTVTNRVTQTITVADTPYEIGFTDTQAYIRRRGSESVTLIPLVPLRADGKTAGVAEVPAGKMPSDQGADTTALAASMVSPPGEAAMLLASPAEHAVHYYHEGMAAPADSFDAFGHQPLAVTIVDRSLRQTAPGTYSAATRLPRPGTYDVIVLLDSPRIAHCFAMDVAARPGDAAGMFAFQPITLPREVAAGRPVTLSFRVVQRSAQPVTQPVVVTALAILAPGSWFERIPMTQATNGDWRLEFTPPRAGVYLLAFDAPSLGMNVNDSRHFAIEAKEPRADSDPRE
jgi:YVTN family beta-propeller protein